MLFSRKQIQGVISNQQALSLIEVIVALSILAFVAIGLMNMYPLGLSINSEAEKSSVASYLCQQKIEQLRASDYEDINVGVIEEKHKLSDSEDDYLYHFWRKTQIDYMDEDLNETDSDLGFKRASTTVYYINGVTKQEESYHLVTLINK